jgi:hypothetical protein
MKVRKAVIAGAVAVALVVLGACGGEGSVEDANRSVDPSAVVHSVGEPVRHGDLEVIVHGVRDPFDPGNPVLTAPPGSRQVAVEVEVKNLSKKAQVLSPFAQFELRDSTNKAFIPSPLPRNVPAFNGGDAPPGTAQRGLIAFNIPAAATGLQLVFQNPVVDEGSIRFGLP